MKTLHSSLLLIAVLVLFGAAAAQAGKQAICHFPPGNPANFHTITVSDNAVAKHVEKHDDLVGSCLENCETICDDEDFCTQDVASDPDQCVCLAEPRPQIDCNDSNPCTVDSCNSEFGCTYDADAANGDACDDGDPDTTGDVCTDGACAGTPAIPSCPCDELVLSNSGLSGDDIVEAICPGGDLGDNTGHVGPEGVVITQFEGPFLTYNVVSIPDFEFYACGIEWFDAPAYDEDGILLTLAEAEDCRLRLILGCNL